MTVTTPGREQLRTAFVEESAAVLPNVDWIVRGNALVFPAVSPSLGTLEVVFDGGEITISFGHRGYHQHHTPDDELSAAALEQSIRDTARDAAVFVAALTNDQIVFRWGLLISGTFANRPPGIVRRIWRGLTPWVREAVWSGGRVD